MRNGLSILFFLLFCLTQIGAQKIDIDKKSVSTAVIELPTKDIDSSFSSFSYKINGSYVLSTWGMDINAVKDAYFKMEGYNPVEKDGDLQLEANISPVKFLDSNVESRTVKTKDKSGRETSTTYYKHVLSYESGFSWRMLDRDGKDLTTKAFSLQSSSIKKHEGKEYGNYKEASDEYNNNRAQITRDIANSEIKNALYGMKMSMNAQFGFRATTDKFNLWVVGSKNHPEYEAFNQHYEHVKAAFGAMTVSGITATDLEALKPSIEYYQSIPEKYKADEKADTKLRYAAYFNLTNIYLFTDNVEKAIEYANLIIKNDYDKGDGKDFLKDAEKLMARLEKKKAATRRFPRV